MSTNRGLTGWRRRESARAAAARREARLKPLSESAQAWIDYWRDQTVDFALGFVYFLAEEGETRYVKIGFAQDVAARVADLQCGNPRHLRAEAVLRAGATTEAGVHGLWRPERVRGEWFDDAERILLWAGWAAQIQREQHEAGMHFIRVIGVGGKQPSDWLEAAA